MEAKKNLCGMIPENLHAKAIEEKEQLGLKTLGDYVELVLKERFEGSSQDSRIPDHRGAGSAAEEFHRRGKKARQENHTERIRHQPY